MKRTFLLVVLAGCACISFGQGKVNVPSKVQAMFQKQFPEATPKWEKEDGNFEAEFEQKGKEVTVLFDENGSLLETEKEIMVSELPATIAEYVKKNYAGSTIKEAAMITDAKNVVTYEAEVKGKDMIFDSQGNFISIQKD